MRASARVPMSAVFRVFGAGGGHGHGGCRDGQAGGRHTSPSVDEASQSVPAAASDPDRCEIRHGARGPGSASSSHLRSVRGYGTGRPLRPGAPCLSRSPGTRCATTWPPVAVIAVTVILATAVSRSPLVPLLLLSVLLLPTVPLVELMPLAAVFAVLAVFLPVVALTRCAVLALLAVSPSVVGEEVMGHQRSPPTCRQRYPPAAVTTVHAFAESC